MVNVEGGKAMARALRNNGTLLSLNMRQNCIGEDGGRSIFEVLKDHSNLERLNLGANNLGP